MFKKIDARVVIHKVKKDLESKVGLDNELTDLAKKYLRKTNPSVFISQIDIKNRDSKDPFIQSQAFMKANAQLKAIQVSRASIVNDVYLGRVKLTQSSDVLFNGELDKF